MIDQADWNLRIFEHIELARILSQLYAANQVECAENDARRNSSGNDQGCVTVIFQRFNDESVFLDLIESKLVAVLANPT